MAKKRKRKLQSGGRALTPNEKLAQRIRSGQRPAQRQSAARRKGRTTSELPSDEVRDRVSNVLPDPRVFERAYAKYQAGENLSTQDKIDLGIETGFAGLAAVPVVGALAQKGKPMIKGLAKKLLGSAPQGRKVKKTKAEKIAAENKAARELAEKNKRSRLTGANRRRANRAANQSKTPNTATSPTSAPMPKKPVTPRVNKPKTPKPETPKKPTSGKSTPKRVVDIVKTAAGRGTPGYRTNVAQTVSKPEAKLGFLGKAGQRRDVSKRDQKIAKDIRTGAKVATGTGIGIAGTKLYDSIDPMPNNKKVDTAKPNKNKEPTVDKMSGYELADDTNIRSPRKKADKDTDLFDTPAGVTSGKSPEVDDGYKFYGKKGTGLGDFSRKYNIKYATPEQFEKDFGMDNGEQMGGRPGKSKMKTQGLNRSKRTGFSGRGTGAALRGF